jgi:hypothetical protein
MTVLPVSQMGTTAQTQGLTSLSTKSDEQRSPIEALRVDLASLQDKANRICPWNWALKERVGRIIGCSDQLFKLIKNANATALADVKRGAKDPMVARVEAHANAACVAATDALRRAAALADCLAKGDPISIHRVDWAVHVAKLSCEAAKNACYRAGEEARLASTVAQQVQEAAMPGYLSIEDASEEARLASIAAAAAADAVRFSQELSNPLVADAYIVLRAAHNAKSAAGNAEKAANAAAAAAAEAATHHDPVKAALAHDKAREALFAARAARGEACAARDEAMAALAALERDSLKASREG